MLVKPRLVRRIIKARIMLQTISQISGMERNEAVLVALAADVLAKLVTHPDEMFERRVVPDGCTRDHILFDDR